MFFGKAPASGDKFYQGASSENPWTQHLHARMFIDQEDTFTEMAKKGRAPKVRVRNPLDPYRLPDPLYMATPPNIKAVSQPTSSGLRHIGVFHEAVPTHRKNERTVDVMREMNRTLGRDLDDLKRYLLDTTKRVAALESAAPASVHSGRIARARTAMGISRGSARSRGGPGVVAVRGGRKRVKPMKAALWDPILRKSLPVQTPDTISVEDRGRHTFPVGPLNKFN